MKSKSKHNLSAPVEGSTDAHTSSKTDFYPLTLELATKLRQADLTAAEWRLWSYLVTLDPFGDRSLGVTDIAEATVLQKCTVYKALKVLDEKGFIETARYVTFREQDDLEKRIRDQLHQELGGLTEVKIAVGRIDLLTNTEVIEVKQVNDWKSALGQVLAYAAFYPETSETNSPIWQGQPIKG